MLDHNYPPKGPDFGVMMISKTNLKNKKIYFYSFLTKLNTLKINIDFQTITLNSRHLYLGRHHFATLKEISKSPWA